MITRLTWAAILSIVMIPLLAIGWLDPLEGLPGVVIGTGLAVAVRLLSKVRIPKWTWISYVVVAALMILAIVLASLQWPMMMAAQQASDTVANPMAGALVVGGVPIVIVLLWISRAADLAMVAGLIYYAVLVFRALKDARHNRTSASA